MILTGVESHEELNVNKIEQLTASLDLALRFSVEANAKLYLLKFNPICQDERAEAQEAVKKITSRIGDIRREIGELVAEELN